MESRGSREETPGSDPYPSPLQVAPLLGDAEVCPPDFQTQLSNSRQHKMIFKKLEKKKKIGGGFHITSLFPFLGENSVWLIYSSHPGPQLVILSRLEVG